MNMLTNLTMQKQSPSGLGSLPSNTVANPRGDVKAITTQSGVAYDGPTIPPTSSPLPKEVKRETEATKDKVQTTSSKSTAHVQPPVVQVPILEPKIALKPNPKPSIPYPLRLNDQKLREKANYQMLKFLQIFQRLHFDLSFADALLHIPKFASTFKSLLSNKEKLFESANTPLNENCSAVLLKKLPKKLRDPVDYDVDPRVPLILGRPFLRTTRALIDVHGEELILRDRDEQLIFHTNTTLKYPNEHRIESVKMINFIDISCEDNFEEELKIKKLSHHLSGGTTSTPDSSPSLTPVETSDYLLKEFADKLALLDPFPSGIGDADFDMEEDIHLLEKLLNNDPSSPLPPKELNIEEIKTIKPLIDYFPLLTDDESLPEEDVLKENFKIYSNPLFEFDDEYISSNVNPLFNKVLEDIESEESYVSNLDEPDLLVTPFSDANKDECFDPGGDIDEIVVSTDIKDDYHDSDGDIIYLENVA
ncbi:hypothetical protein Tco_0214131 [Tanacetum coccineum]